MLPQLVEKSVQSINELTQSAKKLTKSTEGVHGERGGVSIIDEGRLNMWSNWKMRYVTSIHNDDMKCFHVAIQEIDKLLMMGRINFEDHALIKRWWACNNMNAMGKMLKDKKKGVIVKSNLHLLLEVVCVF